MNAIKAEYLDRAKGNDLIAATAFAIDLMIGDKEKFKAGYSAANAAIAAEEVFGIDRVQILAGIAVVKGGEQDDWLCGD